MRWLAIALMLAFACSKSTEQDRPADPPPLIPADEIKRAVDACNGYVTRVCACAETVAAAKEACALAKAIPEAIDVAKRLAANPKADQEDAVQAAGSVRKTVKACIENTAKLPELGCP